VPADLSVGANGSTSPLQDTYRRDFYILKAVSAIIMIAGEMDEGN
jgi:hypothetical protein